MKKILKKIIYTGVFTALLVMVLSLKKGEAINDNVENDTEEIILSDLEDNDAKKYKVVYKGKKGIGKGKHIVFVSTDHEYRGEESLPALARILAKRHGFTCTVIWALDDNGHIFPGGSNIKGLEALKDADLMVLCTRF